MECTVNRVGENYFDQLTWNGHAKRISDLDLFAALGFKVLRYPILWEHVAPNGIGNTDWSWAEERLTRLRELGITPIVGLLHHGSGPRYTHLLDPEFPHKFAAYARAFAERFPWIEYYTPINEPLTTARFSGLYGHWYPHERSDLSFVRMLIHECRATVMAMREIRKFNPQAKLVQTEDLGKVYSTSRLRYQADFENERRWMSWDLLCGRDLFEGALKEYFLKIKAPRQELDWFHENHCPPDIIGVNHYVTSSRFLDERIERYPKALHGGNSRDVYVDIEAVRAGDIELEPLSWLLREAWERYRSSVAITEAHLGCTREEQLRWLDEIWKNTHEARGAGVDMRAVTVWALLGSFEWNTLVTRPSGHYEPGTFDLRGGEPRPTAIASLVKAIICGDPLRHPVTEDKGWWCRRGQGIKKSQPLLIAGSGTLGKAMARVCEDRGLSHRLLSRKELDIADPVSVRGALESIQPWAVVNAAGYVRVDEAEDEAERCFRENVTGAVTLAKACAEKRLLLLTFSSDLVFDGQLSSAYTESCEVSPLNVYGKSKALAEQCVLCDYPGSLIVRTSAFFGPWDEHNFLTMTLKQVKDGHPVKAAGDLVVSPTYVPEMANAALDLLLDKEAGTWHLANRAQVSWAEFARMGATMDGLSTTLIEDTAWRNLGWRAHRPRFSVLGSERGVLLSSLEAAMKKYFAAVREEGHETRRNCSGWGGIRGCGNRPGTGANR